MRRLHLLIRGRVQGVGFRSFVSRRARELGLTGWVRNRSDGAVEVMAEGEVAPLSELQRRLRAGFAGARIDAVEEEWSEGPALFDAFHITA